MAEIQSWQRQDYSKNGSSSKPKSTGSASFHSKPAMQKFADGGGVNENPYQGDDVDPFSAVRDEQTGSTAPKQMTDDTYNEDVKQGEKPAAKAQSFKEAFAENRKAGNSTFEWNGKKFTTEVATGKQAPRMASKAPSTSGGKTFAEDMAERKKSMSVEKSVEKAMTRDENYSNEGRRPAMAPRQTGKGIIDTLNIDSKTLLPKR